MEKNIQDFIRLAVRQELDRRDADRKAVSDRLHQLLIATGAVPLQNSADKHPPVQE